MKSGSGAIIRVRRFAAIFGLLLCTACSGQPEPRVVYITATPDGLRPIATEAPQQPQAAPTATLPLRTAVADVSETQEHVVASGETLFAIAQLYNTTIERIIELNPLDNPDLLFVGQTLLVPAGAPLVTPNLILLSDARFVRGPGSEFDVAAFAASQPGYLSRVTDNVTHRHADGSSSTRFLTGPQIVEQVSMETSIDPRVLLAVLEYRAGWLSNPQPTELRFPLISQEASVGVDRSGLYRQLSWAANELNRGYYGWKYGGWTALEFPDGPRIRFDPMLNAATVALHHMLHLNRAAGDWLVDITQNGWPSVYTRLFGGQVGISEPVVVMSPPTLALPFGPGETWFFTGGPHGGWGTGSAWSALDFAPPGDRPTNTLCFTSQYPARAVADGVIARSADGAVVLDLDGDGNERTGWTVLYLHLDTATTVQAGARVVTGDVIGNPACEGGFSTATHLHIGRRYNGEWIPADCRTCSGGAAMSFTLGGWESIGLPGQEYQGSLRRGAETRVAEQASNNPINQVRHD